MNLPGILAVFPEQAAFLYVSIIVIALLIDARVGDVPFRLAWRGGPWRGEVARGDWRKRHLALFLCGRPIRKEWPVRANIEAIPRPANHANSGIAKAAPQHSGKEFGKDFDLRPKTPQLRSLFDYWNRKRGRRPFILRSELEPREIMSLLPLIFILDVQNDPRRYRIRLMGTEIVQRFGGEYTGRYLDDLDFGAAKAQVLADYDRVADSVEPHLAFSEYAQQGRGRIQAERLALPMSTDGRYADRVLGAAIHVPFSAPDIPLAYRIAPWADS